MKRINIDPIGNLNIFEEAEKLWNKLIGYPEDPILENVRKKRKKGKKRGKKKI